MSSLFTDLKHKNMKGIKRKLEQLTYEIKFGAEWHDETP